MFSDPDFFFWGYEKGALENLGIPEREIEDIFKKARSVKIPECRVNDPVVEYIVHPHTRKFSSMRLVSRNQPLHGGSSLKMRKDVFDLSVPHSLKKLDKAGNKQFIRELKHYLFGDTDYRMTKRNCEEFFDEPANFATKKRSVW